MEKDYTYGVARIRALEGKLFSDDDMTALLQCSESVHCISKVQGLGKWCRFFRENDFHRKKEYI